jgi:hypothetical protein
MSTLFGNLSSNGLEEAQDRLGGGFGPIDSDIYKLKIKALYAGVSAAVGSKAQSVNLIADINGKEYRETFWITNKDGENFFMAKGADGKPTGKKSPLPGFTMVDDICQIATGKPLSEQEAEDKVVQVYDAEQKKQVNKNVPMLVEALGQEVALGIIRRKVNKNVKNDSTGVYEPTAEEREENFTDKVFHPELKLTIVEAKAGADVATFWDAWLELNKGKTQDRRKIKDGQGNGGAAGAPQAARAAGPAPQAEGAAPKKSLFGAKK